MAREWRTVWVLGAGFSRSLGGPLLTNLLSLESEDDVKTRYPQGQYPLLHTDEADAVRWLYAYGRKYEIGKREDWRFDPTTGELLWRHAEEFLDFLDVAASQNQTSSAQSQRAWTLLLRYWKAGRGYLARSTQAPPSLRSFAHAAKRLVAAECALFLADAQVTAEKWGPYSSFLDRLDQDDVIISFNYDLVLELLQRSRASTGSSPQLSVVLPGERLPAGKVPVLKLHGSVDWKRIDMERRGEAGPSSRREICFERTERDDFALNCKENEISIATPGPTKKSAALEFSGLWTQAKEALESARTIVFMGYRFPPSDSMARSELLGAIAANDNPYLAIHTVLGADRNSPDQVRLRELLLFSVRSKQREFQPKGTYPSNDGKTFDLEMHPLFAEDFLTVRGMVSLHQPHLWKDR